MAAKLMDRILETEKREKINNKNILPILVCIPWVIIIKNLR